MKIDSKLLRVVFTSPWPLLLFFIIPFLFILSVKFHFRLPLADSKSLVLYNNACFSLFAAIRCLYYLKGLTKAVRYGADRGLPRGATVSVLPASEVRSTLTAAGYMFDSSSNYAEKHDSGYLGTTFLYAGLCIVLFTGTLDNMRQFSGTLLHGVGKVHDLSILDNYRSLVTGPLTNPPTSLPKMKIMRHLIPDATYPLGADDVVFISPNGKEQEVILKSPDPYRAGSFDIFMARMFYEPTIAVSINGATPVFNGKIMLKPLVTKINDYGFYASFVEGILDGEVYYQPEKSRLKMVLRQGNDTLMNKDLIFQLDRQQTMGNISFTVERMGVWSEIHVVRRRHMPVIIIGGILALIGLVMRIAIRPQRVWLEETPEGCRVRVVGSEARNLLRDEHRSDER